jgi:hypothetical protein
MSEFDISVELDYDDGFREGFLHGMMAAYTEYNGPCDRDDCPKQ